MPQATKAPNQAMALEPQKRGPEPTKREYVERRICEDIEAGKTTPEKLKKTPRKELYYRYADMPGGEKPLSRDTVMNALRNVLTDGSMP
jgi:hypothetical protein